MSLSRESMGHGLRDERARFAVWLAVSGRVPFRRNEISSHSKFSAAAQHQPPHSTPIDPLNGRIEFCMLTVLLVRHGETVHNVAKLYAGITDSEYF